MDASIIRARKVFPRWRPLSRVASSELKSYSNSAPLQKQSYTEAIFRARYEKWRERPTLENATEVIDCAVQLERPLLATGAAKSVLQDDGAMPAVQAVARFVLRGHSLPDLDQETPETNHEQAVRKIRTLKGRLVNEPRNGLLWLEKARLHTEIGDVRSAEISIKRALGCAPDSRLILRAFARFMVHFDRPDEGHERLIRAPLLRVDPWIQAAEIALADVIDRNPTSIKRGREALASQNLGPLQLSELASAIATVEAKSGAIKRARDYFRQSLKEPTENALSQAYWVRQAFSLPISIETSMLGISGAFEARSRYCLERKQWGEATTNCEKWLRDEPFSIRAAAEGSYIASSLLWNAAEGLKFCDLGLVANPDQPILLNNKVVALIRLKRFGAAEETATKLRPHLNSAEPEPTILATLGLLAFSKADIEGGRRYYSAAIERAQKIGSIDVAFRARAHWFYEEVNAGTIDRVYFEKAIAAIDQLLAKIPLRNNSVDVWEGIKARASEISVDQGSLDFEVPPLLLAL